MSDTIKVTCRDCDWSRTFTDEWEAHDDAIAHELDNGHTTEQDNIPGNGGVTTNG